MTQLTSIDVTQSIHPEMVDGISAQITDDHEWFKAHPSALVRFRPADDFDAAATQAAGGDLLHLLDCPKHLQTWIAVIDVPRVEGNWSADESFRLKFRCPPINLDDPQEMEIGERTVLVGYRYLMTHIKEHGAVIGDYRHWERKGRKGKPKGFT